MGAQVAKQNTKNINADKERVKPLEIYQLNTLVSIKLVGKRFHHFGAYRRAHAFAGLARDS